MDNDYSTRARPRGGVSRLTCRPAFRALLAPAAIAAAVALAGCNTGEITPTGRAQAPLSPKMLSLMSQKGMDKGSPILVRIFKEESELEVWKQNRDGRYALLKTYPICRWSGKLGPKRKEGDRQAPEGFYAITPAQMNPQSNYYLAFNTGYPNAYDRAWGRTGSELMVHGDCSSRGCYAMTDEQIQEIYALARESFFGGQKEFQLQAFPFRMTALNMAKHRKNPNFAFWKMLKEGYDHFEATRQQPKIAVCEKRYVFDAVDRNNASPLSSNPRGKCPAYQLDPMVADAVLPRRRNEQYQLAQHIARGVSPAQPIQGDGGMNRVFMAQTQVFDNSGRVTYQVASAAGASAPGALPRTPNPPATTRQPQPASAPQEVKVASVPLPEASPLPKEGRAQEKPVTIASLLGNLFGGFGTQSRPAEQQNQSVALRGTNTELAAKPRRAAPASVHTKSTTPSTSTGVARSVPKPEPKPEAVPAEVRQAAANPSTSDTQARPEQKEPEPQMRTAFAPPSSNGLLSGAQPVMPAGSFNSRWSGLR
jgi:murein L,D-transpeptidase YafK